LQDLHLVDLDGAKASEVKKLESAGTNWLPKMNWVIDFSGGISTRKNVSICFDSGASFAVRRKHCSKR
jgi:phosphoribosylformimino-5-aminoimidazole carboxamide ribotide isomerase